MCLKEIFRGRKKVVAKEIYQPPYRGNSPGMPPPIIIGPIRGRANEWGVQIKGQVVATFTGNPQEIETQKEAFLRNDF